MNSVFLSLVIALSVATAAPALAKEPVCPVFLNKLSTKSEIATAYEKLLTWVLASSPDAAAIFEELAVHPFKLKNTTSNERAHLQKALDLIATKDSDGSLEAELRALVEKRHQNTVEQIETAEKAIEQALEKHSFSIKSSHLFNAEWTGDQPIFRMYTHPNGDKIVLLSERENAGELDLKKQTGTWQGWKKSSYKWSYAYQIEKSGKFVLQFDKTSTTWQLIEPQSDGSLKFGPKHSLATDHVPAQSSKLKWGLNSKLKPYVTKCESRNTLNNAMWISSEGRHVIASLKHEVREGILKKASIWPLFEIQILEIDSGKMVKNLFVPFEPSGLEYSETDHRLFAQVGTTLMLIDTERSGAEGVRTQPFSDKLVVVKETKFGNGMGTSLQKSVWPLSDGRLLVRGLSGTAGIEPDALLLIRKEKDDFQIIERIGDIFLPHDQISNIIVSPDQTRALLSVQNNYTKPSFFLLDFRGSEVRVELISTDDAKSFEFISWGTDSMQAYGYNKKTHEITSWEFK